MIKIEGVCMAKLSMQGYSDFIETEDLELLKVQSETGNVLPRMLLFFKMKDRAIEKVLNEGNTIDVVMGTTLDAPDRVEGTFKIVIPKIQGDSVQLFCVHDSMKYTNTPSIEVFEQKTAFEVIQDLAGRSYTFQSTLSASEDTPMNWKKAFISDKKMVDDVLLHMYLSTDVPLMGITEKGEFLMKSIDTISEEDYKLKITDMPKESKDYPWDMKEVDDQRSLNNASSGYGRSKRVFDAETGLSKILMYKPQPRLAIAAELPKTADVKMSAAQSVQKNENTHDKWEEAEQKNKAEWDSLSSLSLGIYSHKVFIPVNILDLVMFEEHDETGKQIKENYSGLYISTLVCRTIAEKQFSNYVKLCRESTTEPEGTFNLMPVMDMLKGFLGNRINLSKARASSIKSNYIQALNKDALDNLNLPGDLKYESKAVDDIIGSTGGNKVIIDRAVDSIYDNMNGMVDSGNFDKIGDSGNSGYGDFLEDMKNVDMGLDPKDYPDDMKDVIDEYNKKVPDPSITDSFEKEIQKELQDTINDLNQAIKDLENNGNSSGGGSGDISYKDRHL